MITGQLVPLGPNGEWEVVGGRIREAMSSRAIAAADDIDLLFRSLEDFRALTVDRDDWLDAHVGWLPVDVAADFHMLTPRVARSGVLVWSEEGTQ